MPALSGEGRRRLGTRSRRQVLAEGILPAEEGCQVGRPRWARTWESILHIMGGSLLLTENVQKDVTQEVTPGAVLRCWKPRKFRWDATQVRRELREAAEHTVPGPELGSEQGWNELRGEEPRPLVAHLCTPTHAQGTRRPMASPL